jgi:hypothetical protein
LVISGIIVYGENYPFLQCIAVIACNFGMMAYMILIKPFKEEN